MKRMLTIASVLITGLLFIQPVMAQDASNQKREASDETVDNSEPRSMSLDCTCKMMMMMHGQDGMKMDENKEASEDPGKVCPMMPASADSTVWMTDMQEMMKKMMASSDDMKEKGKTAMKMKECQGQMMPGMKMDGMMKKLMPKQ